MSKKNIKEITNIAKRAVKKLKTMKKPIKKIETAGWALIAKSDTTEYKQGDIVDVSLSKRIIGMYKPRNCKIIKVLITQLK